MEEAVFEIRSAWDQNLNQKVLESEGKSKGKFTTVNGIIYGTVPNTIEALNIKEVRNVSMNPQSRRKMNMCSLLIWKIRI